MTAHWHKWLYLSRYIYFEYKYVTIYFLIGILSLRERERDIHSPVQHVQGEIKFKKYTHLILDVKCLCKHMIFLIGWQEIVCGVLIWKYYDRSV